MTAKNAVLKNVDHIGAIYKRFQQIFAAFKIQGHLPRVNFTYQEISRTNWNFVSFFKMCGKCVK